MDNDRGRSADHESGLRRLIADAEGAPYDALRSLDEARVAPDAVVILEGDFGGQIYVTAPISLVHCSEESLRCLLADIDAKEWNEPDGANVFYERHAIGAGIRGGMGGATIEPGVWTHPKLAVSPGDIAAVLAGHRASISAPAV